MQSISRHFLFKNLWAFVGLLLALVTASCAQFKTTATRSTQGRPNVLVILTDDQGWGDLSIHGNTNLKTPHLDSIALEGARLEQFIVCPVCAPTRAEFLTGRYHPRGGVSGVTRGEERLNLGEKTIAEAFRGAGYATAAIGKWHNGTQYPYHPRGRGFDEFYGFCSGHWGEYFDPLLEDNGEIAKAEGYINDIFTDRATAFIRSHKDAPFFCYLNYNTPHSPFQVPDEDFKLQKNSPVPMRYGGPEAEDPDTTRAALAMVENLDRNVGRLLGELKKLKLEENTIVVYFSDNGPNTWRWNGGMKGRKGTTDEGGVRSPCFVRWPGHIPEGKAVPEITGAIDLLPTLCELAGFPAAPLPARPFDGKSLASRLTDQETAPAADRIIFSTRQGLVSARSQRWRLDEAGALFDMQTDLGQTKDVSAAHPEVAAGLKAAVAAWKKDVLVDTKPESRPFPVGYREFPTTWLPARDGIPAGNVKRSAGAPNSSFFTNWKTTDDRMTWDVEVQTNGVYEVTVYYTCRAGDVGSRVELRFHNAKISGIVSESHDPPLRGMEDDRIPRGSESYVKDFRPLALGAVRLEKGRGELTLQALEIPGQAVMDVRAVRLILK